MNATDDRPAQAEVAAASAVPICMHALWPGRVNVRLMREAVALVEAGYRVTVIDIERDASRPTEEDVQGVHFKHIPLPNRFVQSGFKPWFLLKIAGAVLRGIVAVVRTPAAVYHANDDTALPACYMAAVLRRKKLVYDAFEVPLTQANLTRWRVLSTLVRGAFRLMMPRCAGVITVSPPIVDEIERRYGGKRAVLVRNIPPYVPPITSNRLRERLGVSSQTRIALYQGGLQADRKLDILVRAARYLRPEQRIVLMGSGTSQPALEALIEQEQVGARVDILPPVPYEELLGWTASADVGLIIYDGSYSINVQYCLPNKLFEYLMAGVPVLSSRLEAVEELLQHYGVGAVTPSLAPEAVGQSISTLLADEAELAQMQERALAAAQRDLRWDVEQHVFLTLYQSVVGKPAPPRATTVAPVAIH